MARSLNNCHEKVLLWVVRLGERSGATAGRRCDTDQPHRNSRSLRTSAAATIARAVHAILITWVINLAQEPKRAVPSVPGISDVFCPQLLSTPLRST